jgi:hypothetical protein
VRSPKLGDSAPRQYYRYYAGYTEGFVEDMLSALRVPTDGLIVDPWNGAGTTTTAASGLGYAAQGFDINPVAVLIARARLLGPEVADSLVPLAVEISDRARSHPHVLLRDDLLTTWFGVGTATQIRSIERAIHRVLVSPQADVVLYNPAAPVSALAAVFYVALFRTVRDLVQRFVPSNPSWIKAPDGRRVGAPQSKLHDLFVESVRRSNPHLGQLRLPASTGEPNVTIDVASSTNLPIDDGRASAVISSPPYLTRIDYVKATLSELAVLGLTADDVQELRQRMIGTPLTAHVEDGDFPAWGAKTSDAINTIAAHTSKASSTYYQRYYLQYFTGMWRSIHELRRVVGAGGKAVLVVQDSYYKDVHLDLPALIGDMSEAAGWARWERRDFSVPRTMAAINPAARKYRQGFGAVESAVVLERSPHGRMERSLGLRWSNATLMVYGSARRAAPTAGCSVGTASGQRG